MEAAKLKAVWVSHITKFIEWPNITDTTRTFHIKILGTDEFDGHLTNIYEYKKVKGIPVEIKFIEDIDDIGFCHILYISNNKSHWIKNILQIIEKDPILTMSSTHGLGKRGSIINFFEERNRMSFEFNISSAKKNDLRINFRLLEIAKIVKN